MQKMQSVHQSIIVADCLMSMIDWLCQYVTVAYLQRPFNSASSMTWYACYVWIKKCHTDYKANENFASKTTNNCSGYTLLKARNKQNMQTTSLFCKFTPYSDAFVYPLPSTKTGCEMQRKSSARIKIIYLRLALLSTL